MTKTMLAAIAEAVGMNKEAAYERSSSDTQAMLALSPNLVAVADAPCPAAAVAAPVRKLTVPEQILQNWKNDPAIHAEFPSLAIYAAVYTHDAAKKQGLSVAQLKAQNPDLSSYLSKRQGTLAPGESVAIAGYAETWSSSPDIRAEFGTFEVYASYMRAKARGQARILGQ